MVPHHKLEYLVNFFGAVLKVKPRLKWRFTNDIEYFSDDIFWTIYTFLAKFGMVINHHEPECQAKRTCFVLLSSRSRSQGSYSRKMASTISSKLLILLQPNLMLRCIIINQCLLWKDWLAVFKVKVTRIVNTCWSVLYFPHHWFLSLCKQTRCLGVLLLINRLSASKMGAWL